MILVIKALFELPDIEREAGERKRAREWKLLVLLFGAPVDQVAGVKGDAEEIGGDEAELGGADADDADDGAIETSDDPALPESLANQHGGEDSQNAGHIVESNQLEHL
jgi:hypothetical protein